MPERLSVALRCAAAGGLVCLALPPWGFWPLAILGIALFDDLIADRPARVRFARTWLTCMAWLAPGMVWMWDMTPPGYVVATVTYSVYFGLAVAAGPAGRARALALPAAFVVAELARWSFPFGGVPLATLPQAHVDAPWAVVVRLAGPLLLVAVAVSLGQGLRAAIRGDRTVALGSLSFVAIAWAVALASPRATAVGSLEVAAVQGGGPQRTRAASSDDEVVFNRHMEASQEVKEGMDLVLWPENVVNVDGKLLDSERSDQLSQLAKDLDATLIVGTVERISPRAFLNAAVAYSPEGEFADRFDKVRTVPFGEFVPLRGIVEKFSSEVSGRDAIAGSGPNFISTPAGDFSVLISWEAFFANRNRTGVAEGGELIVNPTNGSSYWLTLVQTQQVASLRLRAMESDRWVVEAAPTGFSSFIDPEGRVLQRTSISERAVLHGTVELREGDTLYVRLGDWPMLAAAVAGIAISRRSDLRRMLARNAQAAVEGVAAV